MNLRTAKILALGFVLSACASPPKHKAYPVLEPMDPPGAPVKEEAVRPNYQRLVSLLLSLGYEPVGMEFETDANLDLLNQVFSNPIAHQRKIKLVYTGLQMAYDKSAESLTIGGLTNVTSILTYLQRNVPLNPIRNTPIVPNTPAKPNASPVPDPNRLPLPSPTPDPFDPLEPPQEGNRKSGPELIPMEEISTE